MLTLGRILALLPYGHSCPALHSYAIACCYGSWPLSYVDSNILWLVSKLFLSQVFLVVTISSSKFRPPPTQLFSPCLRLQLSPISIIPRPNLINTLHLHFRTGSRTMENLASQHYSHKHHLYLINAFYALNMRSETKHGSGENLNRSSK